MARDIPLDLEDFREQFADLKAHRSHINQLHPLTSQLHPLTSILTIAVMAVLAGATGPTSTVRCTQQKAGWLSTLLDLLHGLPGKDVYRRVLGSLSSRAFQACFQEWLHRFLQ